MVATAREQQNELIKLRCRMMKTTCKEITAERMPLRIKAIRDQIMMEVKGRWPNVRVRCLADLFPREESAIRDVLKSFKAKSEDRPITAEAVERMRQLRAKGMKHAEIAEIMGITESTIRYHLGKKEQA